MTVRPSQAWRRPPKPRRVTQRRPILALVVTLLVIPGGAPRSEPATRAAAEASRTLDSLPWHPTEGTELFGKPAPPWEDIEWIQGGPLSLQALRGKVVLLRFWLTGCAYCTRTAPALNALWRKYRDRGLVVVGLHHPKSRHTRSEKIVREAARELAFRFPVGMDNDWTTLDRYWTGEARRSFTSVTFLIGRDGRIRFLHDGGEFFPGEGEPGRAYVAMETMTERLLREPPVLKPSA